MNDGFCDCPDGSDEPGTSACAQRVGSRGADTALFHCSDGSTALHTSYVEDGICDCADGSDEQDECIVLGTNGALLYGTPDPVSLAQRLTDMALSKGKR